MCVNYRTEKTESDILCKFKNIYCNIKYKVKYYCCLFSILDSPQISSYVVYKLVFVVFTLFSFLTICKQHLVNLTFVFGC